MTTSWQWEVRDAPAGAHLTYDPATGARILLHGHDQDAVNALSLMAALGGDTPAWVPVLHAARSVLVDIDTHAPHLPPPVRARVLRVLAHPQRDRISAAGKSSARTETASWRRVAYSLDPSTEVRVRLATYADLSGPVGRIAIDRLLADDCVPVVAGLVANASVHAYRDVTAALAASPSPWVREGAAKYLPATDPALVSLGLDPHPWVQQAIGRRLDDEDTVAAIRASRRGLRDGTITLGT